MLQRAQIIRMNQVVCDRRGFGAVAIVRVRGAGHEARTRGPLVLGFRATTWGRDGGWLEQGGPVPAAGVAVLGHGWRAGLRSLARVHEALGHVAELDVEALGGSAQNVEGLVTGDRFTFHQNTRGLADHLPGNEGASRFSARRSSASWASAAKRAIPANVARTWRLARFSILKAQG